MTQFCGNEISDILTWQMNRSKEYFDTQRHAAVARFLIVNVWHKKMCHVLFCCQNVYSYAPKINYLFNDSDLSKAVIMIMQ